MKLTVETLIKVKACNSQVKLFMEIFPEGAEVSEDIAVSVADKFDWNWAASNLLSPEGWNTYEEAEASLYKAYKEAVAPLLNAYNEAVAPLLNAYNEAVAPIWKAYKEAVAPLWKAYEEAKAKTFAKLYKQENP